MSTAEIAAEYQFLSSFIRVNSKDICLTVEENDCAGDGTSLAGCDVECRVFDMKMIYRNSSRKKCSQNAILKTLFSDNVVITNTEYIMPENLKEFYASKNNNKNGEFTMKKNIYL